MAATAQDLQRLLEDANDNLATSARTLREELRVNERLVGQMLQHGAIASVSKNSTSQSYAFGSGTVLSTTDVARAWRDLINCHDGAKAALIAGGTASPTDAQIFTEMLTRLEPVYAATLDLTALRWQP